MILTLLFAVVTLACPPSIAPEDVKFELVREYSIKSRDPELLGAKGIGFYDRKFRDFESCRKGADETHKQLKEAEDADFYLARVKLTCREVETKAKFVVIER